MRSPYHSRPAAPWKRIGSSSIQNRDRGASNGSQCQACFLEDPPAGDLHPLLTGSGPVTFRGLARLKNGALAPSPADEKPQSHDDPNHNENLDYHPEVPPKKSTEFHVDHPSIRGHLSALLSASLRPRGRSGQYAVDCLARREHPEQLARRTSCGQVSGDST